MNKTISRRQLLVSAAAVSAGAALPHAQAEAQTIVSLTAERRILEVDGKAATVFGISGADGVSGARFDPGQRFRVALRNRAGKPTIIHWHGQTPPPDQDGETETGLETLIGDGDLRAYDFAPRPGTHWMHSHQGLQEQRLMAAPLVVRRPEDLADDAQEVILVLQDFSFRAPEEILAQLRSGDAMPAQAGMPGMAMGGPRVSMRMPMAGTAPESDLNDVDFDAYLANDRTLADPQIVRVARGGLVRLRLINAAASTAFWIDLGGLEAQVVAVDGDPVQPRAVRRLPLAEAHRADLLLRLPHGGGAWPIFAQREGGRQRTGIVLATKTAEIRKLASLADARAGAVDLSLEERLTATSPLRPRAPDRHHRVVLGGSMNPYAWHIDGRNWSDHKALEVAQGDRVVIDLVNITGMAHPMHLHGHHFQVQALNGTPYQGAMRDTVLVPPHGSAQIAFDADNPGRWLFHCHNLYHMVTGMITEVAYTGFAAGIKRAANGGTSMRAASWA